MIISSVSASAILDSRKEKTIQVSINGQKASSPSGKSTGKFETPSYRVSLQQSIKDINSLTSKLKELEINSFQDLQKVESLIVKKFKLKSAKQFGANALYALESAILKALAKEQKKPLWKIVSPNLKKKKIKFPIPLGNAIGGGKHSSNKDKPTFQEFLIIPQFSSISKNVKLLNSIYNSLGRKLKSKQKNDESAWQTSLSEEEIFIILSKYAKNKKIKIGTDVAASSFYRNGNYYYKSRKLSRFQQIDFVNYLIKKYSLYYIEDPLEEMDFAGFSRIKRPGIFYKTLICGDDLTVSNLERTKKAIETKAINSIIIKPNQNGSLLEISELFKLCKKHKIKTIFSHRSGETFDEALADYAVAFQADYIKTGIKTKCRECKLNRLIQIEKSIS